MTPLFLADAAFVRWGAAHWTAIVVCLLLPFVLRAWVRRDPSGSVGRAVGHGVAGLLLITWLVSLGISLREHDGDWTLSLPMHLCDWAVAAVVLALLTRRQTAFELAYFWGLAGTLQAILTPDLGAFDVVDNVINGETVSASAAGLMAGTAALYLLGYGVVSHLLFVEKEL